MATIADLIAYRRRHDHLVERRLETSFDSKYGGAFKLYIYVNTVAYVEHIALVKGDISTPGPVPVRMHALNVLEDVLGSNAGGRGGVLQHAMEMIDGFGRGVVVLLREPLPTSLLDRMRAVDGSGGSPVPELRDYGVGAQILIDLGVREMILLTTTHRTIVGLDGYGLTVVEERRIGGVGQGAMSSGD
jgi:3,4-dihydroxy 2-butanone 4-phosphate synthase/GTP cyclohydrolase II